MYDNRTQILAFYSMNLPILFRDCSFVTKITIAQESGAVGIIVMNNDPTEDNSFVDMKHDLSQRKVLIPAAFLQFRDG